jgi:hypothetical protein
MAVAMAALGIFWMVAARNIPDKTGFGSLGPGFLPFWAGASLVCISVALAVETLRAKLRNKRPSEAGRRFVHRGHGLVFLTVIALLTYILLLSRLHFFFNTFLLSAAGLALSGEPFKPRLFLIAALIGLLLFGIFVFWLQIPLPGSRIFG